MGSALTRKEPITQLGLNSSVCTGKTHQLQTFAQLHISNFFSLLTIYEAKAGLVRQVHYGGKRAPSWGERV